MPFGLFRRLRGGGLDYNTAPIAPSAPVARQAVAPIAPLAEDPEAVNPPLARLLVTGFGLARFDPPFGKHPDGRCRHHSAAWNHSSKLSEVQTVSVQRGVVYSVVRKLQVRYIFYS